MSDYKVMGISVGSTAEEVKKAYFKLALVRHPDKGGTHDSFLELTSAYERIMNDKARQPNRTGSTCSSTSYASSSQSADHSDEDDCGSCFYEDIFGSYFNFFSTCHDAYDDFGGFEFDYYQQQKMRAKERAENVKRGFDERDCKTSEDLETCDTCHTNSGITQQSAIISGLSWVEYSRCSRKTCWACKNAHKSVMTEAMATTKFSKVLDGEKPRPVFAKFRAEGKSFSHRPSGGGLLARTRRSVYYWVADLEEKAKELGWKPRSSTPKKSRKRPSSSIPSESKEFAQSTRILEEKSDNQKEYEQVETKK